MAELPRRLGTGTATLVVVANTIGTGIFTTTGLMLAELASPALVLACWLVGGPGALAAGRLPASWLAQKGAALAVVLILTGVHYRGVRLGARVQNALTGLNLALLVGFVVAGFAFGQGSGTALTASSALWQGGRSSCSSSISA